ncbi:tigger transposable element-derived 6-like [Paramuricea clavata]|uniref:Tigger transposable element-derived 6-like n=1 Tax=Paramuricea clavata TaxID=317549 RepID=A0A6S7J8M2_PARCT|nr:tigger transposable element-derived 6-like [Paramuricea clavata]
MMIFKRKRNRPELVDHAPAGTIGRCSPNGWIDADLFLDYLKHFVTFTKCSKDSPVLLILDGHKTHTKILSTIEYARDNGVVILSLPPHTSHKLQPLDRSFFKPLKSAFNAACSTWMRNHPGRRITVDKLGELFNAAYLKAATIENAVSGFRCTGIVPLNKEILPSSDFLEDPRVVGTPSDETLSSLANTANQSPSHEEASSSEAQTRESFPATEETTLMPPVSSEPRNSSPTQDEPPAVDHVSFSMIMKLPTLTEKKKSKRSEESRIVTSSPYKQSLVENIAEQNKKSKRKLSAKEKKSKKAEDQLPKAKKAKTDNKKSAKAKNVNMDIEEDSQCPMCDGFWTESLPGEDCVQCCKCEKWLHEDCCCSVTPTTVICDICYDC